jgi:type VI protein secretion system component VasK
MTTEEVRVAEPPVVTRRKTLASRPARPWFLISAALLLVVLSTLLWIKWRDSRTRADQLQEELKQVYAEAEMFRTEATRAQQRVLQLEREMRALSAQGLRPKPGTR